MTSDAGLAAERVTILDGGTGSELRKRGIALSPVCWSASANLDHAAVLQAIHSDFIRAGADIVTANTFGTTRFVLEAAGLAARQAESVRLAVAAARAAARQSARPITVAASVSCLPPAFDRSAYPPADAEYRAYAELAGLLAGNGVELVLLEMLQDTGHAALACRAVAASGLRWWAGLSGRLATRGATRSGARGAKRRGPRGAPALVAFDDSATAFAPVVELVAGFAPELMAIMHTPLEAMNPALDLLSSRWSGPIGAYAELPYPEDPDADFSASTSPEAYATGAGEWRARGAAVIGGCCGTTPAHIAALSARFGAKSGAQ